MSAKEDWEGSENDEELWEINFWMIIELLYSALGIIYFWTTGNREQLDIDLLLKKGSPHISWDW